MILARYVFAELLAPLGFGVVVFTFVLVLDKLFDLVDLLFNKGVPAVVVLRLFSVFLPGILPLTLPMAVLLACLIAYGRFSQEGELTAVRAAGLSLWRVAWPTFALSAVLSAGLLPFNRKLTPFAHSDFRRTFSQIVESDPLVMIEPRQFAAVRDVRLCAQEVDKENRRLKDVTLYRLKTDGSFPDRIFAKRGAYETLSRTFRLKLEEGQMERTMPVEPGRVMHARFDSYFLEVPLRLGGAEEIVQLREMTSKELSESIRRFRGQGMPVYQLESEFELRHALAMAPVALALLGVPVGMVLERGGRTVGFGVSAAVLFLYYLVLVLGLTLGEKGKLPPALGVWAANFLCVVSGVWLFRRLLRR